jgi:hypothetical protein
MGSVGFSRFSYTRGGGQAQFVGQLFVLVQVVVMNTFALLAFKFLSVS